MARQSFYVCQLAPSTPRTEGIGCGLLLTPSCVQIEPGEDRQEKRTAYRESIGRHWVPGCLQEQLSMLSTPTAADATTVYQSQKALDAGWKPRLNEQIAMLPTPRANKHSPQSREDFTPNLAARVEMLGTPRVVQSKRSGEFARGRNPTPEEAINGLNRGLKLHSDFVAFLMGYPIDWLDIP